MPEPRTIDDWTFYCPTHGPRGEREMDWHGQCLAVRDDRTGRCHETCVTLEQARKYAALLSAYAERAK